MATKRKQTKRNTADDEDYMDIDDEEGHGLMGASGQGYAWEEEYKRSWDILQEDEQGSLHGVVASMQQQLKRRRLQRDTAAVQRGIIRHLYIVVDLSRAMTESDLKPSRLECTMHLVEQFVGEYFDQNPLSQLGLIITRDGLAEKITELSGNPTDHIDALHSKNSRELKGEPSLQNALELARTSLAHVPSHGSREILVLYASLTTCDPGNIMETVELLTKENIRVSTVGLSAEVQICKTICRETKGTYHVVLSDAHYKDLLFENIPPPPVIAAQSVANLIQMGFPGTKTYHDPTLCACHHRPIRRGYVCPRCSSVACEIPTDCPVCTLTLVSSPLLARSYHHLFPVENYKELNWAALSDVMAKHCFACLQQFPSPPTSLRKTSNAAITDMGSGRFECSKCSKQFCLDCDVYVHDVLHNCPGCVNR